MFRVTYWAGPKISTENIQGETYEVDNGMFYLTDVEGNVTFVTRRTSLISCVRLSAIEKSGGKIYEGKAPTDSGSNVRPIKQIDGQN